MESKCRTIKVILIGSISVGKTCLIHHYKTGEFLDKIPSTQDCSFTEIKKKYNNQVYTLNFWDTAGQEKYRSLTRTFMKNSQIVILVYSIVDKASFDDLDMWIKIINENIGEDGYVLGIAANKSDLYKEEKVKSTLGEGYAKKVNAIFKTTSAKDHGISELVEQLLKKYLEKYGNTQNQKGDKLGHPIPNEPIKKKSCC